MSPRERLMAFLTAATVFLGLGWTQAISPALESWRQSGDRLENLEETKRQADDLIARGPQLMEQRRNLELALAPSGAAIPAFLDRIRSLSEAAGFKSQTLRFLRADRYENAFSELKCELRATAPMRQIQEFLVRLAADGQYVRIASLSVAPQSGDLVQADIALVALAPEQKP